LSKISIKNQRSFSFLGRFYLRGHVAEDKVLPDNVASRRERHDRASIKARNPNDKRRVFLSHALRAFNRATPAFTEPAKRELQNAKHQRDSSHQRELAAVPQVGKTHFADVVTRLCQDDEHGERPDEHRVFLVFCGAVSKFRVKVAESKRKRKRNADNRLNRVENFPRNIGEVRLGARQIAKDNRDAEACNQVPAKENL